MLDGLAVSLVLSNAVCRHAVPYRTSLNDSMTIIHGTCGRQESDRIQYWYRTGLLFPSTHLSRLQGTSEPCQHTPPPTTSHSFREGPSSPSLASPQNRKKRISEKATHRHTCTLSTKPPKSEVSKKEKSRPRTHVKSRTHETPLL